MPASDDTTRTTPDVQTVIGANAVIRGDVKLGGDAVIRGAIEGQLSAEGGLEIDEQSTINAAVSCGELTVAGVIEGDVVVVRGVTLLPKATLLGDVVAAHVTIPEGATFRGALTIGKAPKSVAPKTAARTERKTGNGAANGHAMMTDAGPDAALIETKPAGAARLASALDD